MTTRVLDGLPSLRSPTAFAAIQRSIARGHKPGFAVVHFSVMRTHLHLIVEARNKKALAEGMKGLKGRITKALNRIWTTGGKRRRGSVFAERYHARPLSTPTEVRNGLCYVLNNYRRHQAQANIKCHGAWVDPCSSGRQFDGWRQNVRREPGVVRAPKTWLLLEGWRTISDGLDVHAVPGGALASADPGG